MCCLFLHACLIGNWILWVLMELIYLSKEENSGGMGVVGILVKPMLEYEIL